MSIEKVIYFKNYGRYKYLKFNKFGRVTYVIKSNTAFVTERIFLNQASNKITKNIYDINNDIISTEIQDVTAKNYKNFKENEDININIFSNQFPIQNLPVNCVIA